jgi:hypothetical protein
MLGYLMSFECFKTSRGWIQMVKLRCERGEYMMQLRRRWKADSSEFSKLKN